MDKALIIFIKNPEAGTVKTRLAKTIGPAKALLVYNYLLDHTRLISSKTKADRLLFYSGFVPETDDWSSKKFQKHLQYGDDLGSRMSTAFDQAFSKGYPRVIIIGSDCLELNENLIATAFDKLSAYDFVIGPANDGGYYLLGMNSPYPELFKNKDWSTETVFEQTLSQIQSFSKSFYILPKLSDIDTIRDMNEELLILIEGEN
ncbi:glycosyltransferase [Flavihumibacter sp. R14]|nr:glycosyltransferase [Flavihumibacter soli]